MVLTSSPSRTPAPPAGGGSQDGEDHYIAHAVALLLLSGTALSSLGGVMSVSSEHGSRGPVRFAHPDRIRYDGQCFTIDGQDVFLFSAAFHYFRCPRELWPDRFQKIKDVGCNAVETYVAWNWHEREMPAGPDDFSKVDLSDLDDWLTMAEDDFGLHTIVRPGPYICSEWDAGGLPRWLSELVPDDPPARPWCRTDDPRFAVWAKHWFDAVCPVVAKHQITRKPPGQPGVILFQLENEYDYAGFSHEMMHALVKSLAEFAIAAGIEVPLFTCWTRPVRGSTDPVVSQVFDTCNFYPRWDIEGVRGALEALRAEQPYAPLMVTELQGGWFSNIGGQLSENQDGLSAAQIQNLTLYCIENGLTALNYYMFFGGTHFDDWAGRNITTTYDYYSPLRECGGVAAKYYAVQAIGRMLAEHGTALARSEAVPCHADTGHPDVEAAVRRGPDGALFVFLRSRSNLERQGTAVVRPEALPELSFGYELMPRDSRVLYVPAGGPGAGHPKWYPEPIAPPERPPVPGPVRVTQALRRPDPGGTDWTPYACGQSLAAVGVPDNRYVVFRSTVPLTETQASEISLLVVSLLSPDSLAAQVNGRNLQPTSTGDVERTFDVTALLHAGDNELCLLYENEHRPNGGPGMEDRKGISEVRLGTPDAGGISVSDWEVGRSLGGLAQGWWKADATDDGWQEVPLGPETQAAPAEAIATWYRVRFELPETPGVWVPYRIRLDAVGNGSLWLNGHSIGRHWDAGPQRDYFLPECWLKFGPGEANVVTLCLRPTANGAALRSAAVLPYAEFAEPR